MKHQQTLFAVLVLSLAPLQASHALDCSNGKLTTVSGRVTTLNLSQTTQAGQLCMTLTDAKGTEVFDQCGALLGRVTAADPATGASTLSHAAAFLKGDTFHTSDDQAQILGIVAIDDAGVPCAFSVAESITTLKSGTGIFHGATMAVNVQGTVSYCPADNLNKFSLSGEVCLHKKH